MPKLPLPDEVRALLAGPRMAVVGTIGPDGGPSTAATWYGFEEPDRLLLSMDANGPRARALRRDPRVAITVLADDWYEHVSLRGRVVELRPDPELVDTDALSHHYRGAPYPRGEGLDPVTAIVAVESYHHFRSTTAEG